LFWKRTFFTGLLTGVNRLRYYKSTFLIDYIKFIFVPEERPMGDKNSVAPTLEKPAASLPIEEIQAAVNR
jgi:hypothetical protein